MFNVKSKQIPDYTGTWYWLLYRVLKYSIRYFSTFPVLSTFVGYRALPPASRDVPTAAQLSIIAEPNEFNPYAEPKLLNP